LDVAKWDIAVLRRSLIESPTQNLDEIGTLFQE
jgi:hypothetical protein